MAKDTEIKVFITQRRSSQCDECAEELGPHAWITLREDKGALCLACADLDHLEFLPTGDAALTRRARKHSTLSAVVLKFSRLRKHYERQGLLVEENALQQAEAECLADSEARARRREREEERRAELDQQYIETFAKRVRELFPNCPPGREQDIAGHACRKNRTRMDYLEHFQQMIDEYNSGAVNVEVMFERLVKFTKELNEEEQRHIGEQLSVEELAVFDLLTKPEMALTKKEREQVKRVARELLNTLKREKLVLDWRAKQQSRAAVRLAIKETLDLLPRAFPKELCAKMRHCLPARF